MDTFNIPELINPLNFHGPIDLSNFKGDLLSNFLSLMILIRKTEQYLASKREANFIKGPVHLGVGQEAIAVGVSHALTKNDRVFGAHRSHSHILALNQDIRKLFSEVLGKNTGFSKGMGGSMHLWDQPNGFYGSVPIVAGTVPLAVGAGLAAKLQKSQDVAIAYLGDGAVEEGVVHESLNLSKMQNIPIIFIVENNLFASHMHISTRQPKSSVSRFALANDIPYKIIDGNNVIAVSEAADFFIKRAREGHGPGFIEAITYRWYGHVDWRLDVDVGVQRSQDDIENWQKRDPISRLIEPMFKLNFLNNEKLNKINLDIENKIDKAWNQAIEDPYPELDELLNRVYVKNY
jgi:TPP-dependent pyruvate/acetoin dehydrogenase alpha subunit